MGETASVLLGLALILGAGWAGLVVVRRLMRPIRSRAARTVPLLVSPPAAEPLGDQVGDELRAEARLLSSELGDPQREELEESERFGSAVERLAARRLPIEALLKLAREGNRWVARIALGALARRDDIPSDWAPYAARRLRRAPYDQAWLFLRTLERAPDEVIGLALAQIAHVIDRDLAELIAARVREGRENVGEDTFREHVPPALAPEVESLLDEYEETLPAEVRTAFDGWRADSVDLSFLRSFATVWERPYDAPPALLAGERAELVDVIYEAVTRSPPQSLLLVGDHGVGKTALVRAALDRLPPAWIVIEATASSVNAGMSYIGELEGRVEGIVEQLRGRKVVWVFPALEEALYAGQHMRSPTGLLDHLLPHIESGALRIVAEVSRAAYEALVAERPRVATLFGRTSVRPLGETDTIAVARHALEHGALDVDASPEVLSESFEFAGQFLVGAAQPGNLVRLLHATAERVAEEGKEAIETADVLATLASASGLPLSLLDPTERLHLDRVRAFFEQRVLGQPEAVEALVDRIAMVKAGLTDPTRPLGVFLFVGPTGTGKTEIAKALAEFLFGSASRLIRLDMSEFQTPESLERLLSDTSLEAQGAPLIASVRKDPFSVVLLDEFEKAAAPIWDLFLQVFDDGRLTDRHGRTADFRRCVIILTSNVGSSITRGSSLGFQHAAEPFRPAAVERELLRSFRPEFLNRLDQVVVFRPFERSQMRALLEKELADVARRRGLRGRPWAVEFDESALTFLIDEGFSPELGARPLKRAVERHLLARLAHAIVEQTVPEGDQFLFVSAPRGSIEVRFVDPDADTDEAGEERLPERAEAEARELDLRALVVAPHAGSRAAGFLLAELRRIRTAILAEAVQGRKRAALDAVSEPGFWEEAGRFAVLAEAEYLDRLDAALRTADKLGERLERQAERSGDRSSELTSLLASRLYVLEQALAGLEEDAPQDVFVRLRPAAGSRPPEAAPFAGTLAEMYLAWGERRGMRVERLASGAGTEELLAVSGLGAASILAREAGLHVLELVTAKTGGGSGVDRVSIAVQIAPWAPGAPDEGTSLTALAARAFVEAGSPTQVVRRYRHEPAPLVRDAVRGYRTGRLDRVLAGDFDVF